MKPRPKNLRRPRGRPPTGAAMSSAERMRRMRQRRKAAGLRAVTSWVRDPGSQTTYSDHRIIDARSLAMHAVIAQKIEREPSLLRIARRNIARWKVRRQDAAPEWLHQWET